MSGRGKKERSPDALKPEKKLALDRGAAVPSPLQDTSSSSSSGSKITEQSEEMETQSEGTEQSPVRKGSLKLVRQSSTSSQEISTSELSLYPKEDKVARVKIIITQIIVAEQYVEYVYSLGKTKEETEGETQMEWADEEGNKAEKEKGEPKESQTFRYPIFNQQSSGIYSRYIQKDSSYYMERHEKMIMKADLYDENNIECISLKMFKEIAKTLTTPPKVMEVNEESIVMVCGSIQNSCEAFLHFDTKTPILIRYLIRLAEKDNKKLKHVNPEDLVTGQMYAGVDSKNNRYARLIFPEGYLEKTKKYREFGEKIREKQENLEKDAKYLDDEREKRANRRKKDAKRESETFIFLSVDTGMGCFRHIEKIYRLSDVCKELVNIPPQATKVLVTSLDHDPNYPGYALEDYYPALQLVMAKRVQEPEGEIPRVELVSIPINRSITVS